MITHTEHLQALQKQEDYWRERLDANFESYKKIIKEQNDMSSDLLKAVSSHYEAAVIRAGLLGMVFGAFLVMLLRHIFGG